MRINHIGYLCKDINKSIQSFLQLGFKQESDIIEDSVPDDNHKARNVYICFMNNEGTRVELVSPIDENSDVYHTINRNGEGPYHICYDSSDLDESIQSLKQEGWMILKRPTRAIALQNSRVVFLFKSGVGIIELVEIKE